MHIAVVTKYFYPVAAGIENNILQTYSRMAKNGHEVIVHTTRDTYTEFGELSPSETVQGLKVQRYPWKKFGFWPSIDWAKVDVVALHNFNIFPHLFLLLKAVADKMLGRKKYALILVPHGGFSPEWTMFTPLIKICKFLYHYTVGTLLINCAVDGVRCVSPWEADEMTKKGVRASKVSVITNGLEEECYQDVDALASSDIKRKIAAIPRYFVDIGRIYPIKNVETNLRILAKLDSDMHYAHLGPCQDKEYEQKLHHLAAELKVEKRVHFFGVIRGIDKYYILKHAQLMVHPAVWEANANVVHEAWSQDLVTIVADTTGLRPQVVEGERGYRVAPFDVDGFVAKVRNATGGETQEQLEAIRTETRAYVRKHSWGAIAEKLLEFYISKMPLSS